MADQTPTVSYKTGETVGAIEAHNAAVASKTPQVVEGQPTIVPAETPPTSPTVVTPEGNLETPPIIPITAIPENNVSTFKLGFEETPAIPENKATPTVIQPTEKSWKEAIKDENSRKEIFKELGLSEFALEINEHVKNGGDPVDYLNAKAIDYNKISDADIVKDSFRKQYSNLLPEEISRLFNRKYQLDSIDPEEAGDAQLMLKTDAHTMRQQKIQEQSKFKIPPAIQVQTNVEQENILAAQQQQFEAAQKWYSEHEATKSLMDSKRVALNLGDNGNFNFNVDKPELLMRVITDAQTWQKVTSTKQGEPDVLKMQKIALYASNPEQFENDLVNYGKSLALPALLKEGQNIIPPAKVIPSNGLNTSEKELWKSSARTGTVGGGAPRQ